jgi:ABC-type transport system involved in multi-copper enzyme maturation permease subunit
LRGEERALSETLAIAGNEMRMLLPSWRWSAAVILVFVCALAGTYQAYLNNQEQVEAYGKGEGPEPTSLSAFASSIWIGANAALPILAIVSAFDSVTREKRAGGLQLLLSRSTSRASIVAGKFLGGFTLTAIVSLAVTLLNCGLLVAMVGPFSLEEMFRIAAFSAVLLLYLSVWVAIGVLLSTIAKTGVSAAITSILLLLFMGGWPITSAALSGALSPLPSFWTASNTWHAAISELKARVDDLLNWFSPPAVFVAAGGSLLNPAVDVAPFVIQSREPVFPVDIIETLRNVWPCISTMIAMLTIMLITSYVALRTQRIELDRGRA